MAPIDHVTNSTKSPLLRYPYERTRKALEHLKQHSALDACHGLKMEFIDPTTGGAAIPTISTFIQLLPAGFKSDAYRSTDGTIFCVVAGTGAVNFGSGPERTEFRYAPRDIFAVPCWQAHRFAADEETVLFSASDRATQTHLGLWRERRGSDTEN
jgi:gentisate 1,2-dioxygenase